MYKVSKRRIVDQDFLYVEDDNDVIAKICLDEGGRIIQWNLSGEEIIGEPLSQTYASSYAAAVLVPFVNRIERGTYLFGNNNYQLDPNENGINAIHGLVYNRYFELISIERNDNSTDIHLENSYEAELNGYPFSFKTFLVYRFSQDALKVNIEIENIGDKLIPLNLGWHPYFYVKNRSKSRIEFSAKTAYETNDKGITIGFKEMDGVKSFELSEELDHAFMLSDHTVQLKTEGQLMELTFPEGENYLQVYTPKGENYVAIEPMTGISNSFNNNIGLQTLEPGGSISKEWSLKISKIISN